MNWRHQNFAPGGTGAWRTGSEVRGDKIIQKWKPSALGLQNLRAFANSRGHVPQCPMPRDDTGCMLHAEWHAEIELLRIVSCRLQCIMYNTAVFALQGVWRTIEQRREKVTTPRLTAWAVKRVDFSFSIHEERRAASERAHLLRWLRNAAVTSVDQPALQSQCCR